MLLGRRRGHLGSREPALAASATVQAELGSPLGFPGSLAPPCRDVIQELSRAAAAEGGCSRGPPWVGTEVASSLGAERRGHVPLPRGEQAPARCPRPRGGRARGERQRSYCRDSIPGFPPQLRTQDPRAFCAQPHTAGPRQQSPRAWRSPAVPSGLEGSSGPLGSGERAPVCLPLSVLQPGLRVGLRCLQIIGLAFAARVFPGRAQGGRGPAGAPHDREQETSSGE